MEKEKNQSVATDRRAPAHTVHIAFASNRSTCLPRGVPEPILSKPTGNSGCLLFIIRCARYSSNAARQTSPGSINVTASGCFSP